jgi:hypothetical protein
MKGAVLGGGYCTLSFRAIPTPKLLLAYGNVTARAIAHASVENLCSAPIWNVRPERASGGGPQDSKCKSSLARNSSGDKTGSSLAE